MKGSVGALLLLLVAGVKAAGHLGSVTVTRGLVTWTVDGTEYEISSKQSRINGEGPFFDPKSIEFRLPSNSRRFRLLTLFKLARKRNNRVKTFRVNGNTYKVKYNKRGRKVTRVICSRGPTCSRKLSEVEEGVEVEEVVEVSDDVPAGRSLQMEIGWTCDACEDFWDSICDSRGILLLCDDKGTTRVERLRDRFATSAVTSLCRAVADVCEDLDEGDEEEICFLSFGADECPTSPPSDSPTSSPAVPSVTAPSPTSSPTSGPTSQEDAIVVEENVAFAGELNRDIFGDDAVDTDTPGFEIPTAGSGGVTPGPTEFVNPNGARAPVEVTEAEAVQFDNVDPEVEEVLPGEIPAEGAAQLQRAGFVTTGVAATAGSGDDASGFNAIAVTVDSSESGGPALNTQVVVISDNAFLDPDSFDTAGVIEGASRRSRRRRGLKSSDTDISTGIIHSHAVDLDLDRRLQVDDCSDEIAAGAAAGLAALTCGTGEGAVIDPGCVAAVQTAADVAVANAVAQHNARVADARLRFTVYIIRLRILMWQFAGWICAYCYSIEYFPALEAGLGFDVAIANTLVCWRIYIRILLLFIVRRRVICFELFIFEVEQSAIQRDDEIDAACDEAMEDAEDCAVCVATSMRF